MSKTAFRSQYSIPSFPQRFLAGAIYQPKQTAKPAMTVIRSGWFCGDKSGSFRIVKH